MPSVPCSSAKIPATLRPQAARRASAAGLVSATALMLATTPAFAAPQAAASQNDPAAAQSDQTAPAETAPIQLAAAATPFETYVIEATRRGENPFADPDAPYKVDRSASDKLTQPILDTPKSITVIPKDLIDDMGASSFKDVMRTQPGVTLGTGEGGNAFGDRFYIRGFDVRNDVYIDGVRDPGVTSRETFAVQQIEILKGPSSAFAGRGSTGGAVSLVSKQPQSNLFADIDATIGTSDLKRVAVDLNSPLTDTLAIRLNALYHDAKTPGRDEVFDKRNGIAAAVTLDASMAVRLAADYYHLDEDSMPDYGIPYDVANNQPFQVDRGNFYGLIGRDFRHNRADIVTGSGRVILADWANFKSLVRYGQTTNRYVVSAPERPDTSDPDPANWTVQASPKNRNAENEYIANQTDVTLAFDTGPVSHDTVIGFEYSHEKIVNRPYAFLDSEDPSTGTVISPYTVLQNIWNPNPRQSWPFGVTESGSFTDTRVTEAAGYILETAKFGDHFSVLGGLRYDDYSINQTAVGGRSEGSRSNDSTFWNWHLGAVYKPVEAGSIYVSYGSSSNPSGEQVDASGTAYGGLSDSTADLDPERNKAWEAGVKWNVFDQHLNLTAAVFRTDKVNARVSTGGGTNEVTVLDGQIRVDGVEIGATGKITPRWSVFAGVTLLDTEIRSSTNPAEIGAKIPNVSETSFSVTTRYDVLDNAHLGGTALYASKKFGGTSAAQDTFVPGYWRFDAFGGYTVTQQVEVRFAVLNVTNKTYFDALYRSSAPFTYVAPGRSAQVSVDIDF
jgi:catecholate siderophore receptor